MSYAHLNEHDRYVICHMNMAGYSPATIAAKLGRHRATICRELKRNRCPYPNLNRKPNYFYDNAAQQAATRRTLANQRYKLDDSPIGQYVRDGLNNHWSPEQIVGRARLKSNDPSMHITFETIYKWVYRQSEQGNHLYINLRRRRKRRKRRIVGNRGLCGKIVGRIGIEKRPKIVDKRKRFGDWESDTVEGAKGSGLLATHVERKSRYLVVRKIENKKADTFNRASIAGLRTIPKQLRRTLTADNGKEFARFARLESALQLSVYFADPYSPWQRGCNENTNGLLRDFFPKGSDFKNVCPRQVAKAQRLLNNRPRKCLNYRTPLEVLNALPGVALRN